jgi:hypothetical protein
MLPYFDLSKNTTKSCQVTKKNSTSILKAQLTHFKSMVWFGFMGFNATFNNISVISWRSVLLVEETGGPREYH